MNRARPPHVSAWLVRTLLPRCQREFALGDLEEEFGATVASMGLRTARRRYRAEARGAVATAVRALPSRGRSSVRFVFGGELVRATLQDLRFAARAARRRPGTSALLVATLVVGIGATTAVFTLVDRVLLRGLPFVESGQLVDVWNTYPEWRGHHVLDPLWDRIPLSYPEFEEWERDQSAYQGVAVYRQGSMALTGVGDPTGVSVGHASASLWPLLGVSPSAGRLFVEGESGPTAPSIAVVEHGFAASRLGGTDEVVGRVLRLDDRPFEIVGVLPPGFRFGSVRTGADNVQVWLPAGGEPVDRDDGNHAYEAIARLTGPLTEDVREETRRLISMDAPADSRGVRITPRHVEQTGSARGPLFLLMGAVSLLMVLACVNVATLLLGRLAERRGELATRMTLGAGGARLTRQLLAESVLLGGLGAAGGVGVGALCLRLLARFAPAELGLPPDIAIDTRVAAFAALLGLVTSLGFGLLPAVLVQRLDLQGEIRHAPSRVLAGGWRAQRTLIATQFGISLVLLIGTGLLTRSLARELSVDPGFERTGVLTVDIALPDDRYPTGESRAQFLTAMSARVERVPGITRVSGASGLPFSGFGWSSSFDIAGQEVADGEKKPEAARRSILPGYLSVLGVPVIRGREFEPSDRDGAPPVVLISEAMERRFWPGESALGKGIVRDNRRWEIVGIVGDMLTSELTGTADATFYTPILQEEAEARSFVSLALRTEVEPPAVAGAVREAVWDLDPALPVDRVEPLAEMVYRSTASQRYRAFLFAAFGVIATLLAAVGVFGVSVRSLMNRRREMGIRVALGAAPPRLLVQELVREALPVAVGVVVGIALAVATTRFVAGFLFAVSPADPVTYIAAVLGLVTVGFGATFLAARRILRLDPAEVLRSD